MHNHDLTIPEKIKYIEDTLYTVSGKWRLPILMAMYEGAVRFKDLHQYVSNISSRLLSKELKELEAHQLIIRQVVDTYPATITYTLTEYAFTLKPLVDEMISWGQNHRKAITTRKEPAISHLSNQK